VSKTKHKRAKHVGRVVLKWMDAQKNAMNTKRGRKEKEKKGGDKRRGGEEGEGGVGAINRPQKISQEDKGRGRQGHEQYWRSCVTGGLEFVRNQYDTVKGRRLRKEDG